MAETFAGGQAGEVTQAGYKSSIQVFLVYTDWPPTFSITAIRKANAEPDHTLDLDAVYPGILQQTVAVLSYAAAAGIAPYAQVFQIDAVDAVSAQAYTIAASVTRLTLDSDPVAKFNDHLRDTSVFAQSESLPVAWPDASPVAGTVVAFDGHVPGLMAGQALAFRGPKPGVEIGSEGSEVQAEVAFIEQVDDSDPSSTQVTLKKGLQNQYDRRRLTISANVVAATHGDTKSEVLGSGDASQPFQKFSLRQAPLTFVPSDSGSGAHTTLQVRVNGVAWQEVATLYQRGARDRVYLTRVADDGKVSVEFGDGSTGARVPTGAENISATYRIGTGLGGRVPAGQLTLLQTRPLGAKTVTNPLAATGGAEPESLDQARGSAPLTVLTFDRVVSLTDYANYAAAFAGIAKASAVWLWDGKRRLVHVTVAAVGGAAVDPNTALPNLTASIKSAGDQRQPFIVQSYDGITFDVTARIYRDPSYDWATVQSAATAALTNAFSFDAMGFATPVTESAVLATLQAVPGVLGVRLVGLNLTGDPVAVPPNGVLTALAARLEQDTVKPAQLLSLNPQGLGLQEQT